MAGVTITVQGSFDSFHPAERATVNVRVGFEGPDKTAVHTSTARASAEVADGVSTMYAPDQGPVTWWSSEQLRTWSERPWNKDGKQLPLVHHAVVSFQVKFSDFERLGSWVSDIGAAPGVTIDSIDWALTEARRVELIQLARERAVADAREKAQAYAASLGVGAVRPVAVADPGMLGNQIIAQNAAPTQFARAAAFSGGGRVDISFVPEHIKVSAVVDAIFTTG